MNFSGTNFLTLAFQDSFSDHQGVSTTNPQNPMQPEATPPKILRLPQVMELTGLKRATLYDRLNTNSPRYDPTFPRQVRLNTSERGRSAVGFVEDELNAWLNARIAARRDR